MIITAPTSLDVRIQVFRYVNAGTNGRVRPTYQFVDERWGHKEDATGKSAVVAGQMEHVITATITLSLDAVVEENGLLGVYRPFAGPVLDYYKVDGILFRGNPQQLQIKCTLVDDAAYELIDAPVVV